MPIHLCPLAHVLSLEASIVNAYAEIIDHFQLFKHYLQINNTLLTVQTMSYTQKLNSIKPFINIISTVNSMDFTILSRYFTLYHLFIQDLSFTPQ